MPHQSLLSLSAILFFFSLTSLGDSALTPPRPSLLECVASYFKTIKPSISFKPEYQQTPKANSVVFGLGADGYYDFSRQFKAAGVPVHLYGDIADLPSPIDYPTEPSQKVKTERFAKMMDYGASHGGINLIVTSLDPKKVAKMRRAVKTAKASNDNNHNLKIDLDESLTNWEFARALDLYPDRITFWTSDTNGWRKLNQQELTTLRQQMDPAAAN